MGRTIEQEQQSIIPLQTFPATYLHTSNLPTLRATVLYPPPRGGTVFAVEAYLGAWLDQMLGGP